MCSGSERSSSVGVNSDAERAPAIDPSMEGRSRPTTLLFTEHKHRRTGARFSGPPTTRRPMLGKWQPSKGAMAERR
jgi:hypothetical protein